MVLQSPVNRTLALIAMKNSKKLLTIFFKIPGNCLSGITGILYYELLDIFTNNIIKIS